MTVSRPTRVEIDLAALRHNFQDVLSTVGDGCEVLAVVKADAYGHGVNHVAPVLAAAGASMFGVALVEEGVELRRLGIEQPILVLGSFFSGQERDVLKHRLTPVHLRSELRPPIGCSGPRRRAQYRLSSQGRHWDGSAWLPGRQAR